MTLSLSRQRFSAHPSATAYVYQATMLLQVVWSALLCPLKSCLVLTAIHDALCIHPADRDHPVLTYIAVAGRLERMVVNFRACAECHGPGRFPEHAQLHGRSFRCG